MEFKIAGVIDTIGEVVSGETKAGKSWEKLTYTVKTDDQYNNLYALDVFGAEKVEKFNKFNKLGDTVEVKFNIQTNEYNGKYYTSLQSWRIDKKGFDTAKALAESKVNHNEEEGDLPF